MPTKMSGRAPPGNDRFRGPVFWLQLKPKFFPRGSRKLRVAACHFVSEGFQPCLPPLPVLCDKRRKAELLLQTASGPVPEVRCLFPARRRSFPDAEANLQIGPMRVNSEFNNFTPTVHNCTVIFVNICGISVIFVPL